MLPETGVGAGSGEKCGQGLSDAVVWLEQGHRYARGRRVSGALVERIREGDAEAVLAFLAGRSG